MNFWKVYFYGSKISETRCRRSEMGCLPTVWEFPKTFWESPKIDFSVKFDNSKGRQSLGESPLPSDCVVDSRQ
ncbi:MAG: hypothetical protein LBU34_03360 [Planctomycetaceae bacterium]|nr:hypothetical protein [Planctomycetaceae bacterium]